MDRNQSHANGWEPARATAGELMLLKHNYLDGWLQTYIVDLEERRLPEYADMCVIGMLHRAITHAMTNAKSKFRGRSCTKCLPGRARRRCLHHQSSPRTLFTKGRLVTIATTDIWQALRRCGEIFSGEESTHCNSKMCLPCAIKSESCCWLCICCVCAPGLVEAADAANRQNQLAGTPTVLGRLTVRRIHNSSRHLVMDQLHCKS